MKFDVNSKIKKLGAFVLMGAVFTGMCLFTTHGPAKASDHDDGETGVKSRNLNLTDLYVFREDWETGATNDSANLILVMNTNPRSVPRQPYFFNDNANYNFHIGRQATANSTVTGNEDYRFQFSFGAPVNGTQPFTLTEYTFTNNTVQTSTVVGGGNTTQASAWLGKTVSPPPVINTVGNFTVFAGLREDPFFFDVEQFFKVRAFLATNTTGPTPPAGTLAGGFRDVSQAQDFAQGYNVNAIVMRVPISNLQKAGETTFDVWETITLPPTATVSNLLAP